jgi:hypothetical protein
MWRPGREAIQAAPRQGVTYKLTPKQLDQLQHRLDHGQLSQPPSDLKRAKLQEEIEHLRLKNKKLREASTPNWFLAKLLKAMADRIPSIVENRLETYAIQRRREGTGGTSLPGQVHQ